MSLSYGACRILVCITTNMYSTGTILWMLLRKENLSASISYDGICGCDNQWSMTVISTAFIYEAHTALYGDWNYLYYMVPHVYMLTI